MSSLRAAQLTAPIIRFLSSEQLMTSSLASNIIIGVLQGLELHGAHDQNLTALITLGVQSYELLRPKFPNILEVLHLIPNISMSDIQKLDEKITQHATKGNKVDKHKKELFKKITSQIIGRSVGQMFKNEIQIADLPKLTLPSRNSSSFSDLIDAQLDTGVSHLFSSGTS